MSRRVAVGLAESAEELYAGYRAESDLSRRI